MIDGGTRPALTPELDDMRVQARRLLDRLVAAKWDFRDADIHEMALLRVQQADARARLDAINELLTLCEQVHRPYMTPASSNAMDDAFYRIHDRTKEAID